jgi:hypothetical protein
MPDEHRKRGAAIPLAILLAILFRLFVLSEEVAEKEFLVPLTVRGSAVPGHSQVAAVRLSGPRIILWSLGPEKISVSTDPSGGKEPSVSPPKGTRVVVFHLRGAGVPMPAGNEKK